MHILVYLENSTLATSDKVMPVSRRGLYVQAVQPNFCLRFPHLRPLVGVRISRLAVRGEQRPHVCAGGDVPVVDPCVSSDRDQLRLGGVEAEAVEDAVCFEDV